MASVKINCNKINQERPFIIYVSFQEVPCSSREVFEVWSGLVLVALKTIIQASVRFVVRFGGDVAEEADFKALLLGVEDVELPDGDAGGGEPEGHQAVVHQGGRDGPKESAHACVILVDNLMRDSYINSYTNREILTDVDAEVLETRACAAVPSVGHLVMSQKYHLRWR